MDVYMDVVDDDTIDECEDAGCGCECHDDMHHDLGMRLEHGAWKIKEEDGPPFVRKGVFPFLQLPGELREKIYGFVFLQDGNRRNSSYHRGTIHTALLRTGRLIYQEAGNLPLSLNTLNFSSALYALNFFGFLLMPLQEYLVTSIHIEFFYHEFSSPSWELLLCQLGKMPITQLSLTIKGGYTKEAFLGHKCFTARFTAEMKNIESFNVTLGSGLITRSVKEEIQEEMREAVVKGYKRPKKAKPKTKRGIGSESGDKKPAKKAKKAIQTVSVPFSFNRGLKTNPEPRQSIRLNLWFRRNRLA